MSWEAREKAIETAVLIGPAGQDITSAVRGQIQIERSTDSICATGSLPLCDPRLAYYSPGSWARGPQRVEIWLRCRAGGSSAWGDWARLFRGTGELPADHGHWRTRGTLRLVSDAGRWADAKLCVMVPAFASFTRAALLQQMIDLTDLGITISGAWPGGRVLTRPQDYSGQTLPQILSRWCELEGGGYRETDDGLELFDLAECWGPGTTPLWDLTRYYSPAFQGPQKPVTRWIFTGTEPVLPADGTTTTIVPDSPGVTDGPRTEIEITITDGVISEQIERRYDLYAPRGVTPGDEELRLVKQVTITPVYARNGASQPVGQMTSRTTVEEGWYAPRAYEGTTPYYTWSDGTFSTDASETFVLIRTKTETYTWKENGCTLEKKVIEVEEYFAALSEAVEYGDAEITWPDGSVRINGTEAYELRTRETVMERMYQPSQAVDPEMAGITGLASTVGRVRVALAKSERCAAGYALQTERRDFQRATIWVESADGMSHLKRSRTWPKGALSLLPLSEGEEAGARFIPPAEEPPEDVPEPLPVGPMESPDAPVYALRPWATVFTVATAHPENVAPAQELLDAETVEEAERAARYRARIQHAPLVTLYPRANPTRRPWDPVTWTDAPRYSTARQGWVHRQAFALDPLTGHFREELQIKIDPFPETAP